MLLEKSIALNFLSVYKEILGNLYYLLKLDFLAQNFANRLLSLNFESNAAIPAEKK